MIWKTRRRGVAASGWMGAVMFARRMMEAGSGQVSRVPDAKRENIFGCSGTAQNRADLQGRVPCSCYYRGRASPGTSVAGGGWHQWQTPQRPQVSTFVPTWGELVRASLAWGRRWERGNWGEGRRRSDGNETGNCRGLVLYLAE